MSHIRLAAFLLLLFTSLCGKAQTDTLLQAPRQLPSNYLDQVSNKISSADKKISRQTVKALRKFEKLEARLRKKIPAKDAATAKDAFDYSAQKIQELTTEFNNMPYKAITKLTGEYNAYIDTLKTSFKFLQQKGEKIINQSKKVTDKLSNASSKLNVLEGKMLKAEEIKKYLKERKQQLRQQFEQLGIAKELKKMDKLTFYYNEYLKEYKGILKDRKRLEKKAMALLYSTPLFKNFAEKNSLLASLFRLPGTAAPVPNLGNTALAGIQTRASVQQIMQGNIAAGGPNAVTQVRQQIEAGQAALGKLKDKIASYGSADAEIPSFKPNTEKTKGLLKRLEYGANIQFGRASNFLPNGSDVALFLGYKLHTNGAAGVSVAYKLGLGTGWNNIQLTSEGIGIRSYIDWRLKGKVYISGGYEQNYNNRFKNIEQLKTYSTWQSSGLIGLSKKLQIKGNKSVKTCVLFDILYNRHVPVTQPFIFRTAFNLK
jgi:hypothetical protein